MLNEQMLNEHLTIDQMMQKYPNQWLFIVEPKICENTSRLLSGIVRVCSPSRDEIDKQSRSFDGDAAIKFMGARTSVSKNPTLISYTPKK